MKTLGHYLLWSVGLARATTQTTDAERACLARHATGRRALAEIGVWHGVTTRLLRRSMAPDAVLLAIDPYQVGRLGISFQQRIAHREVAGERGGSVRWLRLTGAAAAQTAGREHWGPFDFLFIDGDHSFDGLRADWEGWSPLIATDGVVALHDSRSSATRAIDDAGSVQFTRDVIQHDPRFTLAEAVDTLSVFQRRPDR